MSMFYNIVTYLCDLQQLNGVGINKIYCYNKCGGGEQNMQNLSVLMVKNDKLTSIMLFNSSYVYSPCIYIYIVLIKRKCFLS